MLLSHRILICISRGHAGTGKDSEDDRFTKVDFHDLSLLLLLLAESRTSTFVSSELTGLHICICINVSNCYFIDYDMRQ